MIFRIFKIFAAEGGVTLLEPSVAPGAPGQIQDLNTYLTAAFPLFMGLVVSLAIIMVVWGGLEYMFSKVPGIQVAAKQKIWAAIFGLLLALGAWLLLNTINPQILQTEFKI